MDKKALYSLSYGLYMVGSRMGESVNGQIANTVFQVTSEPPRIAVCINRNNYTHAFIAETGVLAVSVLDRETPIDLIGKFGFKSGREFDKFKNISFRRGVTGAPLLLEHSFAFIEAEVHDRLEVGTHTLFCATVVDCGIIRESEPLTYAYYQEVKKGRAPGSAPTYMGERQGKEGETAGRSPGQGGGKYRCSVCGYIYDPLQGDPDAGIAPGTSFHDLPDTWVCPICGAAKEEFEREV